MRFHQLRICAFGPFPGTETVDFDALSADGLFLMRGATGAGKTSVLDALTFALYGNVPGERSADRLKSQHAPADRVPFVELEFSNGESRYWVRRQPTYFRPAKRAGANPQREGASLVIKRYEAGEWKPVPAARVAEGDHELQQIITLKMHEFTKVILLPQGAFAQLLHATNEERRTILEQLFDIGSYERLEAHLWGQMRQAESLLSDIESKVQAHAAALRSAAEPLLSAEDAQLAEAEAADLSAVVDRAIQVRLNAEEEAAEAARTEMEQTAEQAESLVRTRTELQRWWEHQNRRRELELQRAGVDEARQRIAQHSAAAGIHDWFTTAEEAEAAHSTAQSSAAQAVGAVSDAVEGQADIPPVRLTGDPETDTSVLQAAATQLVQLCARLTDDDAASAEEQHSNLRSRITEAQKSAAEAAERHQVLSAQLADDQQQLKELRAELIDSEQLQVRRDRCHQEVETARQRSRMISQRDAAAAQQEELKEQLEQRQQALDAAETAYRDAAAAYLRGQAHELAETLRPGEPCIVCGSPDHPEPLSSAEDTLTREQVDAAAEQLKSAQASLEKSRAEYTSIGASLEQIKVDLDGSAMSTAEHAQQLLQQAEQQLATAEAAQREQHGLRQSIESLSAREAETRHQHSTAALHAQQQDKEAERLHTELEGVDQRVKSLRAGYASLGERLAALKQLEQVIHEALRRAQQAAAAAAEVRRSRQAAQQQLEKSGFSSVEELRQALCSGDQLAALQQQVEQFDQAERQLSADADQEEVQAGARRASAGEQAPTAEAAAQAQAAAAEATRRCEEQNRQLTGFRARCEALADTAAVLDHTLAQRDQQSEDLTRRADLAKTINGQGENVLRMRLTTFVLAARLERIAEAATHHLAAMTGGRYQLLLDAERAGRGLRGLDLKVHDEFAEQERPAESLSGGETFMTSLAMALGLAEVVQAEAGGIGMESLFIDEGFGSLDEMTLEAVMAALHTLQGEGRRIGVVSHVSDMQEQIPVQLRVEKSRSGSTLRMEVPG